MKVSRIPVFLILFISILTNAQEQKFLKQVQLSFLPEQVSVNRLGGIYLFGSESLIQFDADGKITEIREGFQKSKPVIFEAWNPLRIWLYDGSSSKFHVKLLDHFFEDVLPPLAIDSALAIEPIAIIPGNDNHTAWVLDLDYSLKFIELLNNKILAESEPIFERDSKLPELQFRAHQGFLFVLVKGKEILVINKTGKIIKKIKAPEATWIGVLGEDIYYHRPGKLTFTDIYTGDSYDVSVSSSAEFVLATDERIFEIENLKLRISAFKPKQQ